MYSSIQQGFTPLVSGHFFLPLDHLFLDGATTTFDSDVSHSLGTTINNLLFVKESDQIACYNRQNLVYNSLPTGICPSEVSPVCGKFLIVWTLCMGLSPTLGKYHQKLGFWLEFRSKLWWCYRRKTPSLPWLVFYFWLIGYSCMILPAWKMAFAGLGHIIGALWHVDMVGLPCCLIYCNIGKSLLSSYINYHLFWKPQLHGLFFCRLTKMCIVWVALNCIDHVVGPSEK